MLNAFPGKTACKRTLAMTIAGFGFRRLLLELADADDLLHTKLMAVDEDDSETTYLLEMFDDFQRRFPFVSPCKISN